jgi:hypothetical protein
MKKVYLIILVAIFLPSSCLAAVFSFDPANTSVPINLAIKTTLVLNTEDQEINAVSVKIRFPKNDLDLVLVSDAGSVVTFWIEKPKTSGGDTVSFSGTIPGGYKGKNGNLFSLTFRPRNQALSKVTVEEVSAFVNDGFGTPAKVRSAQFNLTVTEPAALAEGLENEGDIPVITIKDDSPPLSFSPVIARDPSGFDGQWFLVFNAEDKDSGISYYEVQESKRPEPKDDSWLKTESPYVLRDQARKSYVFVRAVNGAGLQTIAIVSPETPRAWYDIYRGTVIVIITVIILCVGFWVRRYRKKLIATTKRDDNF